MNLPHIKFTFAKYQTSTAINSIF